MFHRLLPEAHTLRRDPALPSPPLWWTRLLVIALLLAGSVWALLTIRLETELLALLPPDLPSVRGLDQFARWFSSDREAILVAEETMPPTQRAEAWRRLKPLLSALPGVENVQAPGEDWLRHAPVLAAWMAWNLPPDQFRKLTAALQPESVRKRLAALPDQLAGAFSVNDLARLQRDPLGLLAAFLPFSTASLSLGSQPPSASWLTITADHPLIDFEDCTAFTTAIQQTVEKALPGESRLLLTGRPAFTAEISTQMRRDMLLMVAVAVSLASAAFWAVYRSVKPLAWILATQFLALGTALIGARWSIGSLNVISMAFGCILLGISMDYSILVYHHFASPFRDDLGVWRRLCRGIWFSAATTAAAFLVLAFAAVPGLRQLGTLVAGGLLASAWLATWLLPAAWYRRPPEQRPFLQRVGNHMASALDRFGLILLVVSLGTAGAAGWAMIQDPGAFYAPDLARLQPADSAAFRGQMLLARQDPRENDAIFLVRASSWDQARNAAEALPQRFAGSGTSPLTALIPAPARQLKNRALWPEAVEPHLRRAFADAALGEEWSAGTMTFSTTLTQAASGNTRAFAAIAPLLDRMLRAEPPAYVAVVRIPGAAETPIPPEGLQFPEAEVMPVSWVALKLELDATAQRDLQRLGGGALIVLVLLCALAQRSARLLLLNLAALLLALLLLAALLRLTGTQLGILSLLCLPLLLGLVIDYSLHVLMAMEHEQGDLRRLYGHIGLPILLTGIASCIGFGSPMLTDQPALRNFGLVMDLGIIAAVFTCLFVLPVFARLTTHYPADAPSDPARRQ